jgi:hypothetical protein
MNAAAAVTSPHGIMIRNGKSRRLIFRYTASESATPPEMPNVDVGVEASMKGDSSSTLDLSQ